MKDDDITKIMWQYCGIEGKVTEEQEKLIKMARICLFAAKSGQTKSLPWGIKIMVEDE